MANTYVCEAFSLKEDAHVDIMNWDKIDRHYELSKPCRENRKLNFLWNLFIHSFVFFIDLNASSQVSVYLSSDRYKNQKLFNITLEEVIKIFKDVSKDHVVSTFGYRDGNDDWIFDRSNQAGYYDYKKLEFFGN